MEYIVERIKATIRYAFTFVAARIFADPFTDKNDNLRDLDNFQCAPSLVLMFFCLSTQAYQSQLFLQPCS